MGRAYSLPLARPLLCRPLGQGEGVHEAVPFQIRSLFLLAFLACLPVGASALTLQLSTISSDETDPADLTADFEIDVVGTTLTIEVTNTDLNGAEFNINQIFFNGSDDVTSIAFDGATHSVAGDVTAAWAPLESSAFVNGAFGTFDYALTDGVGENNPNIIEPGEMITFSFTVNAGLTAEDFAVANAQGWQIAAKFVNGPDDDSAFGAGDGGFPPVPEPLTAALLASGLVGLVRMGRRR